MYKDKFGKTRLKLGLHMHTTLSDGKRTPDEVARIYLDAGYDAIALTDHFLCSSSGVFCGLQMFSGCENNVGTNNAAEGVFHIIGVMMAKNPYIMRGSTVQEIICAIHDAGGLAILAHPAWSLNSPEEIMKYKNLDGVEIYNAVSNAGHNRRADSSLIVDMMASKGSIYPLYATDDSHYYAGEQASSYIMLECDRIERNEIIQALRQGRFYATQGPEIHLSRTDDGKFRVDCSEVNEIVFMSNICHTPRTFVGEGLTHAEYSPRTDERYIRAYVTDKNGKQAWSQIIRQNI